MFYFSFHGTGQITHTHRDEKYTRNTKCNHSCALIQMNQAHDTWHFYTYIDTQLGLLYHDEHDTIIFVFLSLFFSSLTNYGDGNITVYISTPQPL